MNTAAKLTIATTLLPFVFACAKRETLKIPAQVQPQQQQAPDTKPETKPIAQSDLKAEADRALAELKTSLVELSSRPEPNVTWTEAEFASYAEFLDTGENNVNKLITLKEKNGIPIPDEASLEESQKLINEKRATLEITRNKIVTQAIEQAKNEQAAQWNKQFEEDSKFLEIEGIPTKSWPQEKLVKYQATLERSDMMLQEMVKLVGENEQSKHRKAVNQARKGLLESARGQ